jgi:ferrochelatase
VAQALESVLNDSTSRWVVRSVFHYGEPTIEEGVAEMRSLGVDDLVIVPLFPQWALSTRGSLEDRLQRLNLYGVPETDKGFSRVQVAPVFYRHSGFLDAQAELLKIALPPVLNDEVAVVYSFHGLPQSHIRAVVPSCKQCLKREGECRPAPFAQPYCYRYQCFETAKLISQKLNLFHWDVAFQSRLGPTRWLDPSLMEVTAQLLDQGVKTLIVQCPSFVVDGLESLEEVGMDLKEYFLRHGGKQFILVPALNHSSLWIEALKEIVLQQMQAIADKDPNGGINHRASNQNN